MNVKAAYIKAIEYYLPEQVLSNEELSEIYKDWTADKIEKKTGIANRHIAKEGETALDLAEKACINLFKTTNLKPFDVDFIILMTQSPDYKLPPSACILQKRLCVPTTAGAFDINLGCSAYIYGLAVAKGLIYAGISKNILLVTAETYTKYIHPMDKSTRTLFGDGASATWVSNEGTMEIGEFDLGTDGTDADKLIVPAGMARVPCSDETKKETVDENGYRRTKENLYMDGTAIFNFSIERVPETIANLLAKTQNTVDGIGLFIFHQANEFMLNYLQKKMRIASEHFYKNLRDVGNTVSSSIPIALRDAMLEIIKNNAKTIMLVGFGVGLSWGSVIINIRKDTIFERGAL